MDDFLFAGTTSTNNCKVLMDLFQEIFWELGVSLADNKTVVHCNNIFRSDYRQCVLMVVNIPNDKVERLKFGISLILKSKKKNLEGI